MKDDLEERIPAMCGCYALDIGRLTVVIPD
jgi:hypothetical protein